MPNPGANNVNGGVLIGTDLLNTKKIAQFNGVEVAQLGTGNRWIEVYEWVSAQGRFVNGGRYTYVPSSSLLVLG